MLDERRAHDKDILELRNEICERDNAVRTDLQKHYNENKEALKIVKIQQEVTNDKHDLAIAQNVKIQETLVTMQEELKPLIGIYKNGNGAYNTITWALKLLAIVGAAVSAILLIKKL